MTRIGQPKARVLGAVRKRPWLPAVVWAAVVLAVSSVPRLDAGPSLFPGCDKVAHFIEYSILGAALRYWSVGPRKGFVAGGVGFAGLDELHQKLVPGRLASVWDFGADAAGLVVGFLASRRTLRWR